MSDRYDVLIAGGGVAGMTAGLTAARAGRRTIVLTGDTLGGHLVSIDKIEGFPGFPDGVPGYDLCPMLQEQASAAGVEFSSVNVDALEAADGLWNVTTGEGPFAARAIVLATGTHLKELGVPGEAQFRGQGVSHCASCDAPLLRGKTVAVVGGGDSAMQEALTLGDAVERVIVLQDGESLTGQAAYRDRVMQHPKIEVRLRQTVTEILGDATVSAVTVKDLSAGTESKLDVGAVFVFIGLSPNTAYLNGAVALDADGRIPTDDSMRTALAGLTAAGTLRSRTAGRAVGAAGDGAQAAIAIDAYLRDGSWR